jgi:thiamine-phosphate pyrophosphorylase
VTPKLIVISDFVHRDRALSLERMEQVCSLARPGSVLLQIRDHELGVRDRLELGRRMRALARTHGQLFGVNDRLDLALVLEADAVHLGEGSVEVADARRLVGDRFVSRACHRLDDLASRGEDAVVLSPIAQARHGRPALGISALRALGDRLLFALGGVGAANAAELVAAGADGVAVMGAVLDAADSAPLVAALEIGR